MYTKDQQKSQHATEVDQFAEFDKNFNVVPTFRIYVEGKGESRSQYVTARNAFLNSFDKNILCCSMCNISQPMDSFTKLSTGFRGKRTKCRACQKVDRDDAEAKKRAKKYQSTYREDHKDEAKEYREDHKDDVNRKLVAKEYKRTYTGPSTYGTSTLVEYQKEYYQENKPTILARYRRRSVSFFFCYFFPL